MLYNSVVFIIVFLPIALLGWFLLQRLENPGFAKLFYDRHVILVLRIL